MTVVFIEILLISLVNTSFNASCFESVFVWKKEKLRKLDSTADRYNSILDNNVLTLSFVDIFFILRSHALAIWSLLSRRSSGGYLWVYREYMKASMFHTYWHNLLYFTPIKSSKHIFHKFFLKFHLRKTETYNTIGMCCSGDFILMVKHLRFWTTNSKVRHRATQSAQGLTPEGFGG